MGHVDAAAPVPTEWCRLEQTVSYVARRTLGSGDGGGASGIGEATCRVLASEGATLVVADKQLEAAQKVVKTLPGDTKHQAMYVDVSDSFSVDELFSNVANTFSQPLSIVVNCAGIYEAAPLLECSDDLFDGIIGVNLRGTFLVTKAAGVVALTKCAAQELAAHGIRCNTVLPGMTETPMIAVVPKEVQASAVEAVPLKRIAEPREIAEAIKYLCLPGG
ncbi:hypothetical protein MTO96_034070 [Rhipicephalus appendiculatus]